MSVTHKTRATGKFLALIASMTMVLAGVFGIALAGPASAAGDIDAGSNSPKKVCAAAGFTGWIQLDSNGKVSSRGGVLTSTTASATGTPGKSGTWTSSPGAAAVYLHAGDKTLNKSMGSGTSGLWSDPQHAISTLTFCYGDQTPPPPVTKCAVGTDNEGKEIPANETSAWCNNPPPPPVDDICADGTDNEGKEIPANETSAWCNNPPPPPVTTCAVGTDNEGKEIPANETSAWCNDTPPAVDTCAAGTDKVGQEIPEGQTPAWCIVTPEDPKEPETPIVPETPKTPVTPETPVTPTVVEEATVTAAEAVPAEAPVTIAAPANATVPVNAKAPATVAVPAAATVPAAVPAGDGSQAPGLPMWALALVAVGIIGAATASAKLVKGN